MPAVQEVVATYVAAWSETDRRRRAELLRQAWADEGTYEDPGAKVAGREALIEHIDKVQRRFPGSHIVQTGAVDAHHAVLRFTWAMVDAAGQASVRGIDFGELAADGRLARIVGFFGDPPAA